METATIAQQEASATEKVTSEIQSDADSLTKVKGLHRLSAFSVSAQISCTLVHRFLVVKFLFPTISAV